MYILSKNNKPHKSAFHAKDFKRCTGNIVTEDIRLPKNKAPKKKRGSPRNNEPLPNDTKNIRADDIGEMIASSATAAESEDPAATIFPTTSNDTEQPPKSALDQTTRDGQSQASTEKRSAITTPSPPRRQGRKPKSAKDQLAQNSAYTLSEKQKSDNEANNIKSTRNNANGDSEVQCGGHGNADKLTAKNTPRKEKKQKARKGRRRFANSYEKVRKPAKKKQRKRLQDETTI